MRMRPGAQLSGRRRRPVSSGYCVCGTSAIEREKRRRRSSRIVIESPLPPPHPPPPPPHPAGICSTFRPADVRGPTGSEEPHRPARRELGGQRQGRRHQLHNGGLEGVHVQHLAPGAHAQVRKSFTAAELEGKKRMERLKKKKKKVWMATLPRFSQPCIHLRPAPRRQYECQFKGTRAVKKKIK